MSEQTYTAEQMERYATHVSEHSQVAAAMLAAAPEVTK